MTQVTLESLTEQHAAMEHELQCLRDSTHQNNLIARAVIAKLRAIDCQVQMLTPAAVNDAEPEEPGPQAA